MPQNTLYRTVAFVTETFPRHGARCIDRAIFGVAGNAVLVSGLRRLNVSRLRRAGAIGSVCVLGDMNIGDAVTSQALFSALRRYLPGARMDYVIKRSAACLVEGNPEIDRVHAVYRGSPLPNENDLDAIGEILSAHPYDLVISLCPFLSRKNAGIPKSAATIGMRGLAAEIVRAQSDPREISHVVWRMYRFADAIFAGAGARAAAHEFSGARVTLGESAIKRAHRLLEELDCREEPRILFNPDTSSEFTRIPLEMQVRILRGLSELPGRILLGEGHVSRGIERALCAALPQASRAKIRVVPASLGIDAYAALIDCCDVFFSGDTGPLHIAAARKYARGGGYRFRNRTAVLSVYAAQPARLYGYDSSREGFFAGNQDAPSRVFETVSHCRNLATVNKAFIACQDASHFFEDLDCEGVVRAAAVSLRDCARCAASAGYTRSRPAGSG